MSNNRPETPIIKLFVCKNKYYFYDTYSNCIFNVTKEQFIELEQLYNIGVGSYIGLHKNEKDYNDIISLIDKGLLRNDIVKSIKHIETDYVKHMLKRHISDICLQVTKQCNFKCRYCLYTNEHGLERTHENINMKWNVAKRALDYLYYHSCDSEQIGISFYGGEPFINFNLIKKVVEYSNSLFYSKPIEYRVTTNGSLLSDDVIEFIVKNEFNLAISFDGDEPIQNKHRKFGSTGTGTFETVFRNIMKIKQKSKNYFNRNVSFISVFFDDENQEEVLRFFENNGIAKDMVLLEDAALGGVDYIPIISNKTKTSSSYGYNLFANLYANKGVIPPVWHHNGPCIPGIKKLFVDTEGVLYPCEKIVEHNCLSIGDLSNGINIDRVIAFMNIAKLSEDECRTCWAMRFCDICVASCNDVNNNCVSSEQKRLACYYVRQKALKHMKNYIGIHDQ